MRDVEGPGRETLHATEIPVLGIRTRFVSNSEHVLDVVEAAFGDWRSLDASLVDRRRAQAVRIDVHADMIHDARSVGGSIVHTLPGDGRLLIHSHAAVGLSEPRRGEATARVTVGLLHDRERFRRDVLEALTLALLTRCDRQPLHAAAVMRHGVGLLLCGPSGTGKSTLAYAAHRAGMTVLSEDMVFVQMRPELRVWGRRSAFHLLPEATTLFAELAPVVPVRLPTGKQKLVVDMQAGASAERTVTSCGLCILGPRRAAAQSRPLSTGQAMAMIDLSGDAGFDVFAATIAPAVERLAQYGAWLLHTSSSPDASIPLLAGMLDSVAAGHGCHERHA